MIDFIGTILMASTGALLLAAICAMTESRTVRLGVASAVGAWSGLAIAIAASGALARPGALGALVVAPYVATVALAVAFPAVRSAMLEVPASLLIGVNVPRILTGVMLLLLASGGRLSGPFPFSAGCGDIIVGALAVPLAIVATRVRPNDPRILAWNVLGALDLVAAMFLGIVSANGSPLQLIHIGVGSDAAQTLPWSLIPTVLVPLFLIGHGILFAQARRQRLEPNNPASKGSAMRSIPA